MFQQLFDMSADTPLTVVLNGDKATGLLTVVVMPRPANNGEPALATPLSLTATPADFEAGFAEAVAAYRKEHRSLAEQAEATAELLRAARDASAKKGSTATARASGKPVRPPPAPAAGASEDNDDDRSESDGGGDDSNTAETAPAPAAASTVAAAPALATATEDLFGD